ncbi:LacI family DNA-binding transcriptional regulator [Ruania alkalisoli]|uniref:LacI family DNA-binding transcriptional regulator n=1 Tax=Ruania alkalisoli TaxID=2779775 RepID=A0A7M1SRF7_9MICO|nr:LacI family DNA-binding transcriptional regulator [Ruania alkalisoli]QOR70150.1 LacI family DNA-binding transcriptional regulator [Ruania alkalisoli]
MAREAGVSIGTVSNVLNGTARVTEATRAKVEMAIGRLGFVRNASAWSLAAGRSSTLGFVIIDLSNSYFLDIARGAEREAGKTGLNLLLANSDLSESKQRTYVDLFVEERVAGILIAANHGSDQRLHKSARGVPVVMVDAPGDHTDVCSVVPDNIHGGYLAAMHLIEHGRRHLLFAGATALVPVRDRLTGVERAVAENPGVVLEVEQTRDVQVEDGRRVGDDVALRRTAERPDGVIAAADLLALGVLQSVLLSSSLRVPEDLALIGYDDNRAAWDSAVPLSTVRQPGEEIGLEAVRLLLEELETGTESHQHRMVTCEPALVVRASTIGQEGAGIASTSLAPR